MQISLLQMERLDQAVSEKFVQRLSHFVRSRCGAPEAFDPSLVPDDDVRLAHEIRAHLVRARGFGLRGEHALAAFVTLAFSYSPDFDRIPRVHAMLVDESVDAEQRIFDVFELVVQAERRQARAPARRVGSGVRVDAEAAA